MEVQCWTPGESHFLQTREGEASITEEQHVRKRLCLHLKARRRRRSERKNERKKRALYLACTFETLLPRPRVKKASSFEKK